MDRIGFTGSEKALAGGTVTGGASLTVIVNAILFYGWGLGMEPNADVLSSAIVVLLLSFFQMYLVWQVPNTPKSQNPVVDELE